MSRKNSNYNIRNRTRDLPVCSAVPQPTEPPRAPKQKLQVTGNPKIAHPEYTSLRVLNLSVKKVKINPLNPELNPICYLLALLGAHHFLHVSRIRVKSLTFRRLMSYIYIYIYIYGAPIPDVSRSHTTTQHSR